MPVLQRRPRLARSVSRPELGKQAGGLWQYRLSAFEGNRHPQIGCAGSFADLIDRGRPGQSLSFRESADGLPGETGSCLLRARRVVGGAFVCL